MKVTKHSMKARKQGKPLKKRSAGKKDARSGGRWLWAAVSVGHGRHKYNHANGEKRFTWKILPHKTQAEGGKPRGAGELKKVFAERPSGSAEGVCWCLMVGWHQ